MNTYEFTVCFYSVAESIYEDASGIVFANTYQDACRDICETIGEDDIISLSVEFITDSNLLFADKSMIKVIRAIDGNNI